MSEKKTTTRRTFLRTSTVAMSGAAMMGGLSVARSAHAAEAGVLTAGLIGCGGRGNGAAGNFLKNQNTKIIAVADAFEDKARGTAGRFNLPEDNIFWGFDAYTKIMQTDCDIVIIATSPGFRPIHYAAAIAAGKHVFMEKPCCVDAPGFQLLMDTNAIADEKGLKVGVGLQRHHQQSYIDGVAAIQDGELGDILFTRVYWNGGGVWTRPRKPEQTEMEYQMRNWYYFNWLCGDNICEQHVHNLDVSNWVKGAHPIEANAMGGREVRKGIDNGEIFDHHFVEFTYPDGTKMYSQCRHIRGAWSSVSEYVHGTKGTRGVSIRAPGGGSPYDIEHTTLIAAILGNKKYNEGWYGATSSFTAVLGRTASYTGQKITWDDLASKGPAAMIYDDPASLTMDSTPPVVPDADGRYAIPKPGSTKPW